MTYHFNRAQRRAIKKVAKARGQHGFAKDVDRICDGIEKEVFNNPNGYQRKVQQENN